MYLREYDFECAVSMAKDGKERGDREHLARALTMLQDYRHALGQLKPGDRMEFGSYFVANDIKPIKLLLRVPIVWLVLENDRTDGSLLLLSERSLDWEFYGDMGACSWEASYLRKWLNGACLDDWFAQEERILMSRTVCRPEKNQISDVSDEETTEDWLFLLSFSEVLQYFGGKGPGKAWKNVRRFLRLCSRPIRTSGQWRFPTRRRNGGFARREWTRNTAWWCVRTAAWTCRG